MKELSFTIHDIIGFDLETADAEAIDFFSEELGAFRSETSFQMSGVHLHWSSRPFPFFNVRRGQYSVHKLLARWRYRVDWAGPHITIRVVGNKAALPMVHHMLSHPAMRFLAIERGFLMLHGAALSFAGRSLLITGPGGTGKTTVSSLLLGEGKPAWQFQSDDYAFLGPGPSSFSFPARSHLYRDILHWQPQIAGRLDIKERFQLEVFGALRKWSRDGITWPVRVDIRRLWPDRSTCAEADLAGIVLLSRGGSEVGLERVQAVDTVIQELIDMNFDEARSFITLIERAKIFSPEDEWLHDWRKKETKFLRDRSTDTPFYRLRLPAWDRYRSNPVTELEDVLLPIVESRASR